MNKKLVIIGGGASGIFCAINAKMFTPSLDVVILERSSKLLSKVKVSGGGRCNVTHACFSIADMIKYYPRGGSFLKKAFHHFFTTNTVEWFKERGVILKTEADGRMFPVTDSSQTIIDCFIKEINQHSIPIQFNKIVEKITREDSGFVVHCNNQFKVHADAVCVASGGNSIANMLVDLPHEIAPLVPSLFTFNMPGEAITKLQGIVVKGAAIKISGTKLSQQGDVLITHWGLSGPAILKLSAWAARELHDCNYNFSVIINWLGNTYNEPMVREKILNIRNTNGAKKVVNANLFNLPQRFWEFLLQQSDISEDTRWADVSAKSQNKLIGNLVAMNLTVKGKTTFKEEFVTAGGVALHQIDHNTMQSKLVPGLYFAGEVLDIDGVTGGFNFQNAWTTGYIVAKAVGNI